MQKLLHQNTPSSDLPAWDYQLHDEVTFNLSNAEYFKYLKKEYQDLILNYNIALGTVDTSVTVGLSYRLGYHIKDDFGIAPIKAGFENALSLHNNKQFSFYFYASSALSYVVRDIFLDGNTFQDSPSVDKSKFLAQVNIGAVLEYQGYILSLSDTYLSKEYSTQEASHGYGSLSLAYKF